MKCIRCGTDSKYKDRQGKGYCASCGEKFAFEPKTEKYKTTDGLFQHVIDDVSAKGTLYFTERQIWHEFDRRIRKKIPAPGVAGGVAIGFFSVIGSVVFAAATASPLPLILGVCGIGAGIVVGTAHNRNDSASLLPIVSFSDFQSYYLSRWIEAHGEIDKLLKSAALGPKDPRSDTSMPSDISAYSFDRALVTGSREIAAMLVANRFHFENNCAILSLDGYPEHVFDTIMSMLRRNPNLTVFAVHNASYAGLRLAGHLREEKWFPDRQVRIVDLGLRPQHAIKMRLMAQEGRAEPASPELRGQLTPEEVQWLESGLFVDLAALRPARLMRALYQGFSRASQMLASTVDDDGGAVFIYSDPGGPWISDPTADVYAPDSFG